jgi:hypothetical protein
VPRVPRRAVLGHGDCLVLPACPSCRHGRRRHKSQPALTAHQSERPDLDRSRGRTQHTVALDQPALLEVLEALKAAEVDDRVRQAAETIYQALIEAELSSVTGQGTVP